MANTLIEVLPKNIGNYKPFLVMQIFYRILYISSGLDFGFYEQKSYRRRFFWKILAVVISVFYISLILILMDCTRQNLPGLILNLCNYFLHVLFLISTSPNKTFFQLHRDLKLIDIKIRKSSGSFNLEKKLLACSMFNVVLMYTVYVVYCVYKNNCLRPVLPRNILLWLVVVSVNMVCISCAFAFYSISCRLKNFASVLKTGDRDPSSMKFIYKSIVDLAEMQKSSFSPMLVLSILYTTFEVMFNILNGVKLMKMETSILSRTQEYAIVAMSLANIFAPALSAEVLATQKDTILLILHDKILEEREPSRQRELERFTRYVEARALRFQLYRVIPLDASLLGMVLNFAVTYLIVIIQFIYK